MSFYIKQSQSKRIGILFSILICAACSNLAGYQNQALHKPADCSSYEADYTPDRAVDGDHDKESRWGANPFPQWLMVDFEEICEIDTFHLITYWDGWRYYRYTIELSLDESSWTRVVDMSENTTPSTASGFVHEIPPTQARFVRVNMLFNSANPGVHIVELEAYGNILPPGSIEVNPLGQLEFSGHDLNAGPTDSRFVTITNSHPENHLVLNNVSLNGSHSTDFSVLSDSGQNTLAPGQSRFVEIAFDPFMKGVRRARLDIASNDPVSPTTEVELVGHGMGRLLPLIPYPESVAAPSGNLTITTESRIVVSDVSLQPMATVLRDEIRMLTGLELETTTGSPGTGDIYLYLDPQLGEEAYALVVDDQATVAGKNSYSVSLGTSTLIQLMGKGPGRRAAVKKETGPGSSAGPMAGTGGAALGNTQPVGSGRQGFTLPHVEIHDEPRYSYRAVSLDVARKHHSIDVLKQLVEVCRFYKLRYMGLHITDDQNFMFPSTAFPNLDQNNIAEPAYTPAELHELEQYARDRGVYIVPELDVPGHSGKMVQLYPEVFGSLSSNTIDFRLASCRDGVKTVINEMCDIFSSTPFFHVGGDESGFSHLPEFVGFFEELNDCVKARGKTTLMWEGFSQGTAIPKDILILNWESSYFRPDLMLQDGYTVINAGWDPLYVCDHYPWIQYTYHTLEHLYEFDAFTFGHVADGYPASNGITVPSTSDIPGAEMCWWEGKEYNAVPFLRNRIPPFNARLWNPDEERCFESFQYRVQATEPLLERLLFPVTVTADSVLNRHWKQTRQFTDTIEVTMSAKREGTIRCTLDGSEPDATSTPYVSPININATTTVKAALFQGADQVGFTTRIGYQKVTQISNITQGKTVTTDATLFIEHPPSLVVDGVVDKDSYWTAYRSPKWIRIDLGTPAYLNSVKVFSRWSGGYYEQYTVDISLDGESWIEIADFSQNTIPATVAGYDHPFPATMVRYIRVNTVGNSWFPSGHFPRIVEIHAGEAE